MSQSPITPRITVLGIGNPVMGDDGIGLEILRRLSKPDSQPEDVIWTPSSLSSPADMDARPVHTSAEIDYIDGGTCGMELLPIVQESENLLLLDAVAGPGAAGDVVKLVGDQVPRLLNAKLSPHQVGLLDLLAAARLLGKEPLRVGVVGIVAESADLHVGLSETVIASLDEATETARELIEQWANE